MATLKEPFALDRSLNTTESPSRNIADVLAEELSRITGRNASQVEYDNTESGLDADNVQDAIDEIVEDIPTVPSVDIQTAVDEFSTYNGGILDSLKVALTPNQDLHGYDSPWVGGAGKNKFNKNGNLENGKFIQADGTLVSSTNWNTTDYQQITPDTYTMSGATEGEGGYYGICWYDSGKTYISGFQRFTTSPQTVTIPSNAQYVRYCVNNSALDSFMLEQGSVATAYEPYENICPISGHTQVDVDVSDGDTTQEQVTVNLGGTYYSGTLDVVSGVFVPDTAKYVLTDISSIEEFTANAQYGSFGKIKASEYPSIKEDISLELASSCKAVLYVNRTSDIHDNRFYINDINRVYIRASVDENVTTVNELFAIFENCEFILPLATPTPIQLSPTIVKALVGENHLSAPLEGQEITESKYRELFTWDEVEAYVNTHSGGGSGMNYSTEEQVVGTWIDGKPIYERTWDFSGSPVMLSYSDWVDSGIPASENIKSIISAELKYGVVNLASVEVGVNVEGYPIGFQKLDNLNTRGVSYCTLRYTKTTD